jgi:arsenate reductase
MKKNRIIVICTANSARSQIAEGFFRGYADDSLEVFSAGTFPSSVHPVAIEVMQEKGIDISKHTSNSVHEYVEEFFDYVITVCDSAKENCPVFYNASHQIHTGFIDPVSAAGNDKTIQEGFRIVRDMIEKSVIAFLKEHKWFRESSR